VILIIRYIKNNRYEIVSSLFIAMLVFLPFLGQKLFSDIVTFSNANDAFLLGYPSFLKLVSFLQQGNLYGIDTDTFNGSSEFFMRSNITTSYLFNYLFALLATHIHPKIVYILFFLCHVFIATFYYQLIARKFFKLSNPVALLYAVCSIVIVIYESWATGFFLVTVLLAPLLYYMLLILQRQTVSISDIICYSFPSVLMLTAGYLPMSVMAILVCLIFAFAYGKYYMNLSTKLCLSWLLLPIIVAVLVCATYYWQVTMYTLKYVQNGHISLNTAVSLSLNIENVINIFDTAFNVSQPRALEQFRLISFGIVWSFIMYAIIRYDVYKYLSAGNRKLLYISGLIVSFFLVDSFGIDFPIAAWFYSVCPIIGAMHLPIRFLMISLPLLYLMLCCCLNHVDPKMIHNDLINLLKLLIVAFFVILVIPAKDSLYILDKGAMEKALLLSILVIISFIKLGFLHKLSIYMFIIAIFVPGLMYFYDSNEIYRPIGDFVSRSIVFNKPVIFSLDQSILANLGNKDKIRFVNYDDTTVARTYVPDNFAWYRLSKLNLVGYSGYEPHLSRPRVYENLSPYIVPEIKIDENSIGYLLDTRADILVVENGVYNRTDILRTYIDNTRPTIALNSTHTVYFLKKYVPEFIAKGKNVIDQTGSFDNGVFYAYGLGKENIEQFYSNDANNFLLKTKANKSSIVEFLYFRNPNLKFYIDGIAIEPQIYKGQAYLNIDSGEHVIEVIYDNKLCKISIGIFAAYYIIFIVVCFYKQKSWLFMKH